MNKEFLQKIQAQLEEQKVQLSGQLSTFQADVAASKENPDAADKDDDSAAEVDTFSTNLALQRTIENELRDVEKSLKRLADGTYGICKYCNKEIDEKRLMVRPTSSACIECKKKLTQEI